MHVHSAYIIILNERRNNELNLDDLFSTIVEEHNSFLFTYALSFFCY